MEDLYGSISARSIHPAVGSQLNYLASETKWWGEWREPKIRKYLKERADIYHWEVFHALCFDNIP